MCPVAVHATRAPLPLPKHEAKTAVAVGPRGVPWVAPGLVAGKALAAAGARVYDPGFAHTVSCVSAVTFIDGGAGVLRYRGYAIEALAGVVRFEEVAFLLLYGGLPSVPQMAAFDAVLARGAAVHEGVRRVVAAMPRAGHPMAALVASWAAMGACYPALNPAFAGAGVYDAVAAREAAIGKVVGGMPAIAAAIYRHGAGLSPAFVTLGAEEAKGMSYAERFLFLVNGAAPANARVGKLLARALDMLLVLHADHELNCSTATMRQLASSGVDVFSCISGSVAALYGPLHGGATEAVLKMLERIGSAENIPVFLERVKNRKEKLMGFGHRVYRNYDPRARIVRSVAYDVFDAVGKVEPLIAVAAALEKAALADDYFVSRKLYPNIDFYSGLIYKAMGFPAEYFTVLFALGRCSGWMAHWREFLDDKDRRIARPHQRYVGPMGPRTVVDVSRRKDAPAGPSPEASQPDLTIAKL